MERGILEGKTVYAINDLPEEIKNIKPTDNNIVKYNNQYWITVNYDQGKILLVDIETLQNVKKFSISTFSELFLSGDILISVNRNISFNGDFLGVGYENK